MADERLIERVASAMFEDCHDANFAECTENRRDWLSMAMAALRAITEAGQTGSQARDSGSNRAGGES